MNDSAASEARVSLAGGGNFRRLVGDDVVVVDRRRIIALVPVPIARSETLGGSASASCSTGADGGNCAGCAIGGTLSIASALLSGKMNDGARRGCTGAAAGALTGCSCGKTSGVAGAAGVGTGRRSPFRRRLTVGYSTGSALRRIERLVDLPGIGGDALGSKLTV